MTNTANKIKMGARIPVLFDEEAERRWYLRRRDDGPTEIIYDGHEKVIEKRYDVEEIILKK